MMQSIRAAKQETNIREGKCTAEAERAAYFNIGTYSTPATAAVGSGRKAFFHSLSGEIGLSFPL